jgi:hypothetical protein
MKSITLAVTCMIFISGCSSLPMNIPVNPTLPDLKKVSSQGAQRTPLYAIQDPDRAKRHIGDVPFDRQGLADVLSVAPTQ